MRSVNVILAACLAFMAGHASAEVSDMTLGYCAGQLPTKGDISYGEADKWVSGAIYITPGMLSTYSGNELVGVNAGLASKLNIDELTVWLRHDNDKHRPENREGVEQCGFLAGLDNTRCS